MDQLNDGLASLEPGAGSARKAFVRAATLMLWGALVVYEAVRTAHEPSPANIVALAAFVALLAAVNVQLYLLRWLGNTRLRRAMARIHGSAYISELEGLPNRNYLLSELRREMPRARHAGKPFVLVVLSLDTIDEVRERRGDEFAGRAIRGLAEVLKRFTRTSDFIAHLGGHRFCVLLVDCTYEDSAIYLKRVPGTIAVSDGRIMLEVPVHARLHQYDMESLYATDVLSDAEAARPLRRRQTERFDSLAA